MKKFITLLFLCAFAVSGMAKGKKLPPGTYMWSDYETAKEEAIAEQKPLLVMYTSLTSK